MADELTRLSKENAILREQMENVRSSISATMPNPEEANSFLRNIYNAFMQIGGGSYVPLDTLKRHLSGIYSDNLFDSLLIEARTKNPDKVWIDKAIDKDRQVQTTIVKIKEL